MNNSLLKNHNQCFVEYITSSYIHTITFNEYLIKFYGWDVHNGLVIDPSKKLLYDIKYPKK